MFLRLRNAIIKWSNDGVLTLRGVSTNLVEATLLDRFYVSTSVFCMYVIVGFIFPLRRRYKDHFLPYILGDNLSVCGRVEQTLGWDTFFNVTSKRVDHHRHPPSQRDSQPLLPDGSFLRRVDLYPELMVLEMNGRWRGVVDQNYTALVSPKGGEEGGHLAFSARSEGHVESLRLFARRGVDVASASRGMRLFSSAGRRARPRLTSYPLLEAGHRGAFQARGWFYTLSMPWDDIPFKLEGDTILYETLDVAGKGKRPLFPIDLFSPGEVDATEWETRWRDVKQSHGDQAEQEEVDESFDSEDASWEDILPDDAIEGRAMSGHRCPDMGSKELRALFLSRWSRRLLSLKPFHPLRGGWQEVIQTVQISLPSTVSLALPHAFLPSAFSPPSVKIKYCQLELAGLKRFEAKFRESVKGILDSEKVELIPMENMFYRGPSVAKSKDGVAKDVDDAREEGSDDICEWGVDNVGDTNPFTGRQRNFFGKKSVLRGEPVPPWVVTVGDRYMEEILPPSQEESDSLLPFKSNQRSKGDFMKPLLENLSRLALAGSRNETGLVPCIGFGETETDADADAESDAESDADAKRSETTETTAEASLRPQGDASRRRASSILIPTLRSSKLESSSRLLESSSRSLESSSRLWTRRKPTDADERSVSLVEPAPENPRWDVEEKPYALASETPEDSFFSAAAVDERPNITVIRPDHWSRMVEAQIDGAVEIRTGLEKFGLEFPTIPVSQPTGRPILWPMSRVDYHSLHRSLLRQASLPGKASGEAMPSMVSHYAPRSRQAINESSLYVSLIEPTYRWKKTHFGGKGWRSWLQRWTRLNFSALPPLLGKGGGERRGVSRSRQVWEPITLLSWMMVYKLLFVMWVERMGSDFYHSYGKEILLYFISLLASLGFDAETLIDDLGLGEAPNYFRIIPKTATRFHDLAGIDTTLPTLGEMVWFLRSAGRGKKIPKGFLLVGPPGTGKTFLVQAIAGEAEVPVVIQSATLLIDPESKESPVERLQNVFQQARRNAPCILFIDEIDTLGASREGVMRNTMGADRLIESVINPSLGAVAPGRGIGFAEAEDDDTAGGDAPTPARGEGEDVAPGEGGWAEQEQHGKSMEADRSTDGDQDPSLENTIRQTHQTTGLVDKQRLSLLMQLLVEMDGLSSLHGLVVVGATNRPGVLDPALLRPGRFERVVQLELPGEGKRIEILRLYSQTIGVSRDVSWRYLAHRTVGFSAADLSAVMNQSSIQAILDGTTHTIETIEAGIETIGRRPIRRGLPLHRHRLRRSRSRNRREGAFSISSCRHDGLIIRPERPSSEQPFLLTRRFPISPFGLSRGSSLSI